MTSTVGGVTYANTSLVSFGPCTAQTCCTGTTCTGARVPPTTTVIGATNEGYYGFGQPPVVPAATNAGVNTVLNYGKLVTVSQLDYTGTSVPAAAAGQSIFILEAYTNSPQCAPMSATPNCPVTCTPYNPPWTTSMSCLSVPRTNSTQGVQPSTSTHGVRKSFG